MLISYFFVAIELHHNYRTQLPKYFLSTSEMSKTTICFGHWMVLNFILSPLIGLPIHSSKILTKEDPYKSSKDPYKINKEHLFP